MGVDEGNLQVKDIDVILENCPITIVILNLLVYGKYNTVQYQRLPVDPGSSVGTS